jgi:hypothetical protein
MFCVVSTKMLKATWIAARPQWYLASIGKTNSVQPLQIGDHQHAGDAEGQLPPAEWRGPRRDSACRALIVMCFPLQAFLAAMRWLPSRTGVGLHRAMNLKQRLYRLISSQQPSLRKFALAASGTEQRRGVPRPGKHALGAAVYGSFPAPITSGQRINRPEKRPFSVRVPADRDHSPSEHSREPQRSLAIAS